jgi:predicted metal-dependent hydrolase
MLLEKYKASRAAYHGGNYNDVSCRRMVGSCHEIIEDIGKILLAKKNAMTLQSTKKYNS